MPRYHVALTAGAERDLDGICAFREAAGSDAVDEWMDSFEEAIGKPETFPDRGSVPPELDALGIREFRQKQFKPYRIIYRTTATDVFSLIIAHGICDFQSLLQERLLKS